MNRPRFRRRRRVRDEDRVQRRPFQAEPDTWRPAKASNLWKPKKVGDL